MSRLFFHCCCLVGTSLVMPLDAFAEGEATASSLDTVVITSGRSEQGANLSPKIGATVYRIDTQAIEAQALGSDTPISEVLLRLPGVAQDSKGSGSMHVRGDHGNVQYRIDGVQLPESITGFGQSMSTRVVDRIDFVTGALPAQYGLRTAGIVEITTKVGDTTPGGRVGVLMGSHNHIEPSAELFGGQGDFRYYLSGSHMANSLGIENRTPGANALHDRTSQTKTFGNLSYAVDESTKLGLLFGSYNGKFQIPNNPSQTPQYTQAGYIPIPSSQINGNQNELNHFLVLTLQKNLGDISYQASFFNQYSSLRYTPDTNADLAYLGTASNTMRSNSANGVQFDLSNQLNAEHTLRLGVAYTRQLTQSNNLVTAFPADSSGAQTSTTPVSIVDNSSQIGTLSSLYVQDEWRVSKPLTVNYGLRFDSVSAFIQEQQLSPRINAAYKPDDRTSYHAGYSRYFTPPPQELASQSSINLYTGTTAAASVPTSSPVKAERTQYFDFGMSHKVDAKLTLGANAYYKKINNLIDEGQFGQALILSPFNYQMGYAKGLELSAVYLERKWGAFANVTHATAQGQNIMSGQSLFSANQLSYISNHDVYLDHNQTLSASSGAHYRFGNSKVSADVIYGSGLRNTPAGGAPNSTTLPSYTTVNAAFTHTWRRAGQGSIEGRIAVINLFDRSYLLRDGTGVGVGAPQYGASRGFYVGLYSNF